MSLAEGLRDVARAAGLPEPEAVAGTVRQLPLMLPPDEMAFKCAEMLGVADGSEGLFLFQGEIVTIDRATWELKPMRAVKFRSWLPDERKVMPVAKWDKESGMPIKGGLSKDQAEVILASDILRKRLPVITAMNGVRMPVLRGDTEVPFSQRPFELLPKGYDVATGIYTAGTVEYAEDMDFDEAVNYFYGLFRTFSWRNADRDFAIHLAAIVTLFCRGLYQGKAPMIVYNANIQESGKTTLSNYVSWLVYGGVKTKPLLQDAEGKLEQTLNSMALAGAPYSIFDNVDWGNTPVKTELLDQWISNEEWDFRKLGGNEMAAPVLRGLTMMTGNALKLSADLQRRSLIADLWNPLAGAERVLSKDAVLMDGVFFKQAGHRRKGLAAVWALVRGWDAAGRPMRPGKELGSFNDWSRVIASIVWHAGQAAAGRVWDCLAVGENEEIGDKDSREYKSLAMHAIAEFGSGEAGMKEAFEVTVQQFAGVARRQSVATFALYPETDVEGVMSTEGKPGGWKFEGGVQWADYVEEVARMRCASQWLTPKTRSSFGKALDGRLHDKYFPGPDGEHYHVLKLKGVSPARYAVKRVVKR